MAYIRIDDRMSVRGDTTPHYMQTSLGSDPQSWGMRWSTYWEMCCIDIIAAYFYIEVRVCEGDCEPFFKFDDERPLEPETSEPLFVLAVSNSTTEPTALFIMPDLDGYFKINRHDLKSLVDLMTRLGNLPVSIDHAVETYHWFNEQFVEIYDFESFPERSLADVF